MMAIAFIIRGLKEFGEPTRKALIMDLAPEDKKTGMFGLYYLMRDIIVSVAAFGGAFLWQISPTVNLLVAAVCGLTGAIYLSFIAMMLSELCERELHFFLTYSPPFIYINSTEKRITFNQK